MPAAMRAPFSWRLEAIGENSNTDAERAQLKVVRRVVRIIAVETVGRDALDRLDRFEGNIKGAEFSGRKGTGQCPETKIACAGTQDVVGGGEQCRRRPAGVSRPEDMGTRHAQEDGAKIGDVGNEGRGTAVGNNDAAERGLQGGDQGRAYNDALSADRDLRTAGRP